MNMALNMVLYPEKVSKLLTEVGMGRVEVCELLQNGGRRVF